MTFDILIRNGVVVSSDREEAADVGIVGGQIAAIGDLGGASSGLVLDAKGLAVMPGLIDTQVHFREPGAEHKEDLESGSRAALAGGVTTFFEMPNTNPPTVSKEALQDKLNRAKGRCWSNYAFFVGATSENVEEIPSLERLDGAAGIKIFMGSSTGSLLVPDDDTLRRILTQTRRRVSVHSEDHFRLEERKPFRTSDPSSHPVWRDAECARLSTERLLRIAEETGAKVHVLHISTADELPLILAAKERGVDVTAEVTPQHLWFTAPACYERLGTRAQMNPPLRDVHHRGAIRKALEAGLFDVFGSDHAPHTLSEKAEPYPASPSGMPGVQTLLPALLTLGVSPQVLVRMAAENPARLFCIANKGRIAVGFDADLVLVDLKAKWTVEKRWLESKCGWSPFEGETMTGQVKHVLVSGNLSVRDGEIQGIPQGNVVSFRS